MSQLHNQLKHIYFLLLSLVVSLYAATTSAAEDKIVVFGDSLSDPGNAFFLTGQSSVRPFSLLPDAPYARGGLHFTNGKTWIEQLAKQLHQHAGPAFQAGNAFTNYAIGGARASSMRENDLITQVNAYLALKAQQVAADALHVIFVGGNDLRDAILALSTDPSGETSAAILQAAVTGISDSILALQGAGAQKFLVVNAPDLSLVPAIRLQGPVAQFYARLMSSQFNQALQSALNGLRTIFGLNIKELDVFLIINQAVANPQAHGFVDVEHTCILPGVVAKAVCNQPDDYLFWDGIHPTEAGHKLIAQGAYTVLQAE